MSAFGKCDGGGRRTAARASAPLSAILTTISGSTCADLIDVSCTGARVRGTDLPNVDELVEVKIERSRAFAQIVWSHGDECGLAFDTKLPANETASLMRDSATAKLTGLSVEERLALQDWLVGVAR